jgi:hypothetical protein
VPLTAPAPIAPTTTRREMISERNITGSFLR